VRWLIDQPNALHKAAREWQPRHSSPVSQGESEIGAEWPGVQREMVVDMPRARAYYQGQRS